eukprot:gene13050-15418_t
MATSDDDKDDDDGDAVEEGERTAMDTEEGEYTPDGDWAGTVEQRAEGWSRRISAMIGKQEGEQGDAEEKGDVEESEDEEEGEEEESKDVPATDAIGQSAADMCNDMISGWTRRLAAVAEKEGGESGSEWSDSDTADANDADDADDTDDAGAHRVDADW